MPRCSVRRVKASERLIQGHRAHESTGRNSHSRRTAQRRALRHAEKLFERVQAERTSSSCDDDVDECIRPLAPALAVDDGTGDETARAGCLGEPADAGRLVSDCATVLALVRPW